MSIVSGSINGEKTTVAAKATRITDPEIRRLRQGMMYRQQLQGMPIASIAKLFGISRAYAYQELDDLPEKVKRRIRECHTDGEFGMAG